MSTENHLYRIVRTVHGATRRLLDDVTEEESLVTGTAMALAAAGSPIELPAG